MNLAEALDILPDVTTTVRRKRTYKLDPRFVGREHLEEGTTVVLAHVPGSTMVFRFTPQQWQLVHLFDGIRSYPEISELFQEQAGIQIDPEDIRRYADEMEEAGLWYLTPQEKNIALMQKLRERRKKVKKARAGDFARVMVAHWDADEKITRWHEYLRFIFTPWFTALTVALFLFMVYIFVAHWSEIGQDTLEYYTFTDKSAADLAEFWILFFILAFFHESAHALCCKHYKGGVHSMGFHLIYLSPAFFVDVTEAWVYANRVQRVITMMAGIWTELMICALAAFVWWGTPAGSATHDLAYKLILITGVAVVILNLNPLIKLDGYYVLCEAVGIDEIKERSTAYVSGWVQSKIFRMPVEVPFVRPGRRLFFVIYAVLSGLYSYLLLYAAARFVGNLARRFTPQWAFLITAVVALLIFKSRILKLGEFMRAVYREKREHFQIWTTPSRLVPLCVLVAALLLIPFRRDTVRARFILEPTQRAVVRSEVAGTVTEVLVDEGQKVEAGAPLLFLQNRSLESQQAEAERDLQVARSKNREAELQYADPGATRPVLEQSAQRAALVRQELTQLELRSPIAGTVTTPRPGDLLGSHLPAGTTAVEVADLSTMRARLFVPEAEMRDVKPGEKVRLRPDYSFRGLSGVVGEIALASSPIEPGLEEKSAYKGLAPPGYYALSAWLPNQDGKLKLGVTGTAKIYTVRRSLIGVAWRDVSDFLRRKVW
jgi:putative peptide zinc metalloprotease protein